MSQAARLRDRAAAQATAQGELERAEIEAHLALPPGERLRRTLELSAAYLEAFPPAGDEVDDEAEVWRRVRDYLRSLSS
jgi:hypothetical protein